MSIESVLELIKANDAHSVDLRFTDTRGKEQHVTIPASSIDETFFKEGEIFDDEDGFRTGVSQVWREATFTLAYIPHFCKDVEIRGEVRHDWSNVASFERKHNAGSKDYQQSVALEAFWKFG